MLSLFQQGDVEKARKNFKFSEPRETCLGLSEYGTKGKSLGQDDATKLFEYILSSGVMEDGLVSQVNDIKIFVDNISHDKISDLTTNIIRKHLIEYTQKQCELYGIKLKKSIATNEYWNTANKCWESSYEDMLVINNQAIILVPKSIVCRKRGYFYDSEQYARHFVLNFLVSEEIRLNTSLVRSTKLKNGDVKKSAKKDEVAKKHGAYKKEFLRRFTLEYPEYYQRFKAQAKSKVSSLSSEEIIENYTEDFYMQIIDRLIGDFNSIKSGTKDANKFHEHIIATMNFLFYPSLMDPIKEQEIHGGRKRIDLVYDNAAESGYFFNLSTVKEIPSSYIMVECKNYTKDVANPEIDQLNGRFSPNRGKMGFLVFRSCENESALIERCRDVYKDNRNLIIPVQDKDFIKILKDMKEDSSERSNTPQEKFLGEITRKIIIS
ncbi:hypothetical protein [Listeria grandensis]|uniref:hypothetical protein n=1 Tax=Listeria grandensis TaxID=1494963 RepID=UPI0004BB4A38|nr:hypothetical protein [Listeria grandensis]